MPVTISTPLPNISFIKNIPDLVVSEVSVIAYMTIAITGNSVVNDIALVPDKNQKITINTTQIVRHVQSLAKPTVVLKSLPKIDIRLVIGDQTFTQTCLLVPGGVAISPPNITDFLSRNFLSWQPQVIETTPTQPQWMATILPQEYAKFEIHSTLYNADGRTFTKIVYTHITEGLYYRQNRADFAYLWGSFCEEQRLEPICYDVWGVGYMSIGSGTSKIENRPFVQRYKLRRGHASDIFIGFTNTLGGFDTLILEGRQTYLPSGETTAFRGVDSETEISNDYTSTWEGNSGYFESERASGQFHDFLKSTQRYIFKDESWQQIIVSEYEVKHTPNEINSYTFKYHLAKKNESRNYERTAIPHVEFPNEL